MMRMTFDKPRIALFSDLHLGKHNNSAAWHRVAVDWCDWFITDLTMHNIKDVVFLGDWHDNRDEISVHTLDVSALLVDKFRDFNLHMVVGNHDIPYKHSTEVNSISVYASRPNIEVYKSVTYIEAFDRCICFAPWDTDISKLKQCDVLFGHLEIQSFKMGLAKTCDKGWAARDLVTKCSNVFSGHFHIRGEKEYKEGTITYIGNPFQMDFGDRYDTKGYYIYDLDSLQYQFVKNTVSPIHKVVKVSDIENGVEKIELDIIGNIIKLDIDIDIDDIALIGDKLSALKPMSVVHDYTFQEKGVNDESVEQLVDTSIDIKEQLISYIDSVELYSKNECKEYIVNLYEKSRV